MNNLKLKISKSARKFLQKNNIVDVTFSLFECDVVGCCIGAVKEIQAAHKAPLDASGYYYIEVEGYHIFISRQIKIIGSLTLNTEGFGKRLCLDGAIIPI